MGLSGEEGFSAISRILQEYAKRHRNITRVLPWHGGAKLAYLFPELGVGFEKSNPYRELGPGSYFKQEI